MNLGRPVRPNALDASAAAPGRSRGRNDAAGAVLDGIRGDSLLAVLAHDSLSAHAAPPDLTAVLAGALGGQRGAENTQPPGRSPSTARTRALAGVARYGTPVPATATILTADLRSVLRPRPVSPSPVAGRPPPVSTQSTQPRAFPSRGHPDLADAGLLSERRAGRGRRHAGDHEPRRDAPRSPGHGLEQLADLAGGMFHGDGPGALAQVAFDAGEDRFARSVGPEWGTSGPDGPDAFPPAASSPGTSRPPAAVGRRTPGPVGAPPHWPVMGADGDVTPVDVTPVDAPPVHGAPSGNRARPFPGAGVPAEARWRGLRSATTAGSVVGVVVGSPAGDSILATDDATEMIGDALAREVRRHGMEVRR